MYTDLHREAPAHQWTVLIDSAQVVFEVETDILGVLIREDFCGRGFSFSKVGTDGFLGKQMNLFWEEC